LGSGSSDYLGAMGPRAGVCIPDLLGSTL